MDAGCTTWRRSRTSISGAVCSPEASITSTGRVANEATEVLTLREMIVPAMMTGTAPVVAPDQIIFVLGDFRGDVWIRDV